MQSFILKHYRYSQRRQTALRTVTDKIHDVGGADWVPIWLKSRSLITCDMSPWIDSIVFLQLLSHTQKENNDNTYKSLLPVWSLQCYCPVSVCHESFVLSKQLYKLSWFLAQRHSSTYPTECYKENPGISKIRVEPYPKLWHGFFRSTLNVATCSQI